jgi:glycosyltransferase involved in cell wall biosynthesis
MIKILHIVNNLRVNGRTIILYEFIRHTRSEFVHEVVSLLFLGAYESRFQEMGVNVSLFGEDPPAHDIKEKINSIKCIAQKNYDLCICWSGKANMFSLIPKILGIPVIWTIHNAFHKWGDLKTRLGIRLSALLSLGVPHRIVCCSKASFEAYEQVHGYASEKLILVQNGIDVKRFHPDNAARCKIRNQLHIPLDDLVVAFPTRFGTGFEGRGQKDPATFLRAVSIIRQKRPDMKFLMFGPMIDKEKSSIN